MSNNNIRGIDLHDNIRLVNPKPVDAWSGPYKSVEEANRSIVKSIRYPSMIVRIISDNKTFLYWYKDGIEDVDLVQYLFEDIEKINSDLTTKYNELSGDLNDKYNELNAKEADKHYEILINNPSKVWNVKHNLNKYPSVTVINNDRQVVIGSVEYID